MDRKGTEAEVRDRLLKSNTGTGYLKGKFYRKERFMAVFRIRIRSFLGLTDPDPDPDHSIIKQK